MKRIITALLLFTAVLGAQINWSKARGSSSFPLVVVDRTTAIASTTIFSTGVASPGGDTTVRLSLNITCKSASASATITATLNWTDSSNTAQSATSPTATCTTLGSTSFVSQIVTVRVKGNTNVNASTTIANTPTYDATLLVENLGG